MNDNKKTISFTLTTDEKQRVKDLKYHNNKTAKDIFLAGLVLLENKVTINLAKE